MLALATVGPGFCFSLSRYLRLLVWASFFLAQPLASCHILSENPCLTLAKDLRSGKTLSLTVPSGFVVENHSTQWASGSSAASLAHSSAISFPSMPWWLGHHLDVGLLCLKGGDVPPGFEGVLLRRSRFVGGHPSYGRLAVRQDGHKSERVAPGCCYLQGPREDRALGVVGFLAPAHVGLVALSRLALLLGNGVAGCSVLQSGPVREDGEPWPVGPLCLVCRCLFFLDGGGCLQRGGYLEEDRFFRAVPASEVRLEPLSERAVRGSDEFPGLAAPWQAGESEGEAVQAVVQLGRCRPESGFQTEGPLVGGPEGSQGESRLPVHYLLHVFLSANSALDPVTLPPEFRSEQSDRLDTCCLDPPAVLWRKADLPRESPEPVLRVPGLLHPDIMVILQG